MTDLQLRLDGLVTLLFGLFTIWAVHRPWYLRSRLARAWFWLFGPKLARVLLTVLGVCLAVLGALMLCGVRFWLENAFLG
jgi:hypothetical protein